MKIKDMPAAVGEIDVTPKGVASLALKVGLSVLVGGFLLGNLIHHGQPLYDKLSPCNNLSDRALEGSQKARCRPGA